MRRTSVTEATRAVIEHSRRNRPAPVRDRAARMLHDAQEKRNKRYAQQFDLALIYAQDGAQLVAAHMIVRAMYPQHIADRVAQIIRTWEDECMRVACERGFREARG